MTEKKNRRYSVDEIDELIRAWAESGNSKKNFCAEHGLNYMTFIGWFGSRKGQQSKEGFVELSVKESIAPRDSVFAEIHLNKGRAIFIHQIVSAEYLRDVVR